MTGPGSTYRGVALTLSGIAIVGGIGTFAAFWQSGDLRMIVPLGLFTAAVLLPFASAWGAWQGDARPSWAAGGLLVALGVVSITSIGLLLVPLGVLVLIIGGLLHVDSRSDRSPEVA